MMGLPLGCRVSGAFGTKAPIKIAGLSLRLLLACISTRLYMRGDYYVVPPNGACIGVHPRILTMCGRASA